MSRREVANGIASRYPLRPLREYVRWKIRTDPAYEAVAVHLRGCAGPIVDVGCGVGALAFYLREAGVAAPLVGIDFDDRKIAVARLAAGAASWITFLHADARAGFPAGHNVVMLDVLQYFDAAGRRSILANAAQAAPEDGVVVIRSGIRDSSWRYTLTWLVDSMARAFRWMRGERLQFPTREEIAGAFEGFRMEVAPCRGHTPFNNFLFVFRRSVS